MALEKTDTFSKRLKEALANKGMTAAELSKATGITQAAISRYLKGERTSVSADRIASMAGVLGVSEAWLMGMNVASKPIPEVSDTTLEQTLHLVYSLDEGQLEKVNAFITQFILK